MCPEEEDMYKFLHGDYAITDIYPSSSICVTEDHTLEKQRQEDTV